MASCTFFGHHDCPETIRPKLREAIVDMIVHSHVDMFYVGNHGYYDAMVRSLLRELQTAYPQIGYAVVLAYLPGKNTENEDFSDTMLPEGIENTPRRFAISWRNKWMVNHSGYVIAYVTHDWGGAWQFTAYAEKHGKTVRNLAEDQ